MKIGRNDLCPCGSGKKYKQCCLQNENKDIRTLVRETVKNENYKEDVADVLCNLIRYMEVKQWMGACHASASVLYVVFSELGYNVELFIGEVKKSGGSPFDHSWITLDGKIIDIAIMKTLTSELPTSDAIVLDKNIRTKQKHEIEYGIDFIGLGAEAKSVFEKPFVDYMDGYPDEIGGLWDVIDKISPVPLNRAHLKEKYKDTKRIYDRK